MLRRALPTFVALVVLLGVAPTPAAAQFGAIEAFARRVSDLSFYFSFAGVADESAGLEDETFGIHAFGVEMLFEIAEITRPVPGAVAAAPADSVRRIWTDMEIVHTATGVDTIYRYEIERIPRPPPPTEAVWLLEMGIGYGQLTGFELRDPTLDMNVSIRDLPAVSLYASYEPWGNYFGLRTGFMRTQSLVVIDGDGNAFNGDAEAFLFGGLTGYAFALADLWLLVEGGYTIRSFPSVEWSVGPGGPALPSGVPRQLDVSGWFATIGLQFPFR